MNFDHYRSIFALRESPLIPHLLCCQGLTVPEYGFALDASDLRHPRLLQHRGKPHARGVLYQMAGLDAAKVLNRPALFDPAPIDNGAGQDLRAFDDFINGNKFIHRMSLSYVTGTKSE